MLIKKRDKDEFSMTFKNFQPISFKESLNIDKNNNQFGECKCCYNFDTTSDVLKDGFGIEKLYTRYSYDYTDSCKRELSLPEDKYPTRCFFIRALRGLSEYMSYFVFFDNDNYAKFYRINQNDEYTLYTIPSLECSHIERVLTTTINGEDGVIFVPLVGSFDYIWQPRKWDVSNQVPSMLITSICQYGNRSFATGLKIGGDTVMYSEEFNPLNFTSSNKQSGYINMSDKLGMCKKVIVFKNNVYVFRENGINKIVESRDRVSFETSLIFMCKERIYENTICDCGDKILFCTTEGLYEFDGSNVKKIDMGFESMFKNSFQWNAKSTFVKGVYYLACNLQFGDGEIIESESRATCQYNSIVKYDLNEEKFVLCRGVSVVDFVPIVDDVNNTLAVLYANSFGKNLFGELTNCGYILNKKIKKGWTSTLFDFGDSEKVKYIKDVRFVSKADITLKLYLDKRVKSIKVKGKDTVQTIKINEKAKIFGYGFETSECGNYITNPTFSIGTLN